MKKYESSCTYSGKIHFSWQWNSKPICTKSRTCRLINLSLISAIKRQQQVWSSIFNALLLGEEKRDKVSKLELKECMTMLLIMRGILWHNKVKPHSWAFSLLQAVIFPLFAPSHMTMLLILRGTLWHNKGDTTFLGIFVVTGCHFPFVCSYTPTV